MTLSNPDIAKLLRSVAAAMTLKKDNLFRVRAYETAADAIEHSSAEVKDLWEEGKLKEVPGIGEALAGYLEELFKTGRVKHFESIMGVYDSVVFKMLDIPGVGPKTAVELAKLGVQSLKDLESKLSSGELIKKGFSAKNAEKIFVSLKEYNGRAQKRMLLPFAVAQAEKVLNYLHKNPQVLQAHSLGSLRRRVATVGDLDFAACCKNPKEIVDYFIMMPGVSRVVGQGENRATVVLHTGLHVDLLVGEPDTYGALLQHFTGSKHHNIHIRNVALEKGYSLSEYGVKKSKSEAIIPCKTEDELYKMLGMQTPAPELREDTGEIEVAIAHKLPNIVRAEDLRGDLHLHSNYPMAHPSHSPGADSLEDIVKKAVELGYEYVGISDHPPGKGATSEEEMTRILYKRNEAIEQLKYSFKSKIKILGGLEIDILPNGVLSVPNEVLAKLDYCIAGVHSVHRMPKDQITKRILTALASPHVDILSHPTGRLLNERDSSDADWVEIFKFCAKNNKLLEINAFPNRLDLRDDLVREALKYGVKFIINSDAHEVSQMENLEFGASVAKRGWAQAKDIVNTWEWKKFAKWFNISK